MHLRSFALLSLLIACSSSDPNTLPDAGGDDVDAAPDAVAVAESVTFTFTPGWDGVQSVAVIGGFGRTDDWTAPLLTLTKSGATFTGVATLPPGDYLYVFHVIGDAAAGAKAATFPRYVIDPVSQAFAVCPAASPTYNTAMNPCAQLSVPSVAATTHHVRGKVIVDGIAAASYLVEIERQEPTTHHYFANRVTTAANGTFDLVVAPGSYRIQVLHPQFESKTDAELDPAALGILRRDLSSTFVVGAADVTLPDAEVAFHDYATFAPRTTATLPTTFAFGTTGGLQTHLGVYGTAMHGAAPQIGDPWFSSASTLTGGALFTGTFTSAQASETAVQLGERYFWGVTQNHPAVGGVMWTGQSLVYPVTWH